MFARISLESSASLSKLSTHIVRPHLRRTHLCSHRRPVDSALRLQLCKVRGPLPTRQRSATKANASGTDEDTPATAPSASSDKAVFDLNLYKELIDPRVFGTRGEPWFFAQLGIVFLVFFPPALLEGVTEALGVVLILAGLATIAGGVQSIGSSISPFPTPRPTHELVTSGTYAYVRHPMYTGVLCCTVGFSLWMSDPTRLALCVPLYYVLDKKATLEEAALSDLYPAYEAYSQLVGRLLPWPILKKQLENTLTSMYKLLNKSPPEPEK